MDEKALEAFAVGLGALPAAVQDVVRRAVHHFGDTTPDAEQLTAWGAQLKAQCTHLFVPRSQQSTLEAVAAKHGMSVELWQSLSPEERYTREKAWQAQHGQGPPPRQKPQPYRATADELQALEGKSLVERLTFAHERAQQQG